MKKMVKELEGFEFDLYEGQEGCHGHLIRKKEKGWSYSFSMANNESFEIRRYIPFTRKNQRVAAGTGMDDLRKALQFVK